MSNKSMKMVAALAAIAMVLSVLVASCGPTPAPEVVEKVVKETVVVEKEVEVTKVVEKEVEVTTVVEKEVVVTATPEPEKAGPVSGGHLMLAFESNIDDTGDLIQAGSSHTWGWMGNLIDPLIRQDPADGTFHPALAESWEVADDGLSITLYLRQDVKFHDGTPFNAEAVKYNLDRILTVPGAQGQSAYTWLGVGEYFDKVEVIDEYTVKLSYKKVYALMIWCLSTGPVGGMHSPTAIEKYGDKYGTEIVVTTGPFEWVAWTGPTGIMTTKRNEEYNWASPIYKHQGPAYLDGFTVQGILETSTRAAAVEVGSLHAAPVADKDMARFNEMPGFRTMPVSKRMTSNALWFNLNNPILKDIRVRQAIAHAIDREGIIASPFYSGSGQASLTYLDEGLWGRSTEEFREYNYLYDPDKAKALLEEVGWKDEDGDGVREAHGVEGIADGTPLHLVEQVLAATTDIQHSEISQGMLAKVGIDDELEIHDWGTSRAMIRAGDFEMAFMKSSGHPIGVLWEWFHSDGMTNIMSYSNPEVDALIDAAFGTIDPDEQWEYMRQAQIIILEDVPGAPTVDQVWPWAVREEVEGLTTDPLAVGMYLYDTWINPNP